MKRDDQWTCRELDLLRRNYTKMTNQEIAQMLKRSLSATNMKAYKLGLKKERYGIEWTPQMLKILRDFFPMMFNKPLAKWLGVSQRTMIRKARELGLEKREGFLDDRRKEIQSMAEESRKKNPDGREAHYFKKGVRVNPAGEFKKGHTESHETKAKRIAALKARNANPELKARRSAIAKEYWRKRKAQTA